MMKKYHFNMVEIMLAIVVLALGMASVFVLFPAGLDNHRTAMAENNVADMAELVISHVRAEAALYSDSDKFDAGYLDSLKTYSDISTTGLDNEIKEMDEVDSSDPWSYKKVSDGLYLVRQFSGPVDNAYVDFAAVVKVYKDEDYDDELFVLAIDDSGPSCEYFNTMTWEVDASSAVKDFATKDVIVPLVVEISYPANVPEDERDKSYFRFEIFNERYVLKK